MCMTPAQLRSAIAQLGLSQEALGRFLGHPNGRTVRRWLAGEARIPEAAAKLLRLMLRLNLSPDAVDLII